MAQNLSQDLIVMLVPVPRLAQPPTVDDVANQEQILTTGPAQEIGEKIAPSASRAEMNIGDEHAPVERPNSRNDRGVHMSSKKYSRSPVDKVKFA